MFVLQNLQYDDIIYKTVSNLTSISFLLIFNCLQISIHMLTHCYENDINATEIHNNPDVNFLYGHHMRVNGLMANDAKCRGYSWLLNSIMIIIKSTCASF